MFKKTNTFSFLGFVFLVSGGGGGAKTLNFIPAKMTTSCARGNKGLFVCVCDHYKFAHYTQRENRVKPISFGARAVERKHLTN